MKSIVFAALVGLFGVAALAAKPAVKCSNGEETTVELYARQDGNYRADVTVQSVGDSYPTFHFRNVRLQPTPPRVIGAPQVYKSASLKLEVVVDAMARPGYLTVPSLGIKNEELSCR